MIPLGLYLKFAAVRREVPDANLLLYTVNSASPFHPDAAKWWAGCLLPGEDHVRQVVELLTAAGASGGNLVTDAQVAALARAHRAEVHTADHDFRRFPGLTCHYPLS